MRFWHGTQVLLYWPCLFRRACRGGTLRASPHSEHITFTLKDEAVLAISSPHDSSERRSCARRRLRASSQPVHCLRPSIDIIVVRSVREKCTAADEAHHIGWAFAFIYPSRAVCPQTMPGEVHISGFERVRR